MKRCSSLALALLTLTGCSQTGKLDIRAVGNVDGATRSPSERTALAMSQLALGNVGLALEGFRRAAQEDPSDVDALLGVAACYDRMERFDLSRHAYEQALAVEPGNLALYQALAASLDAQGLPGEAGAVRREAAARQISTAPRATTPNGSVASLPQPVAAPSSSVTILLPPPRPAAPAIRTVRLERLSQGEVALLTSTQSPWRRQPIAAEPRWLAIRPSNRVAMVVLNGARVAGLAARTRDYLAKRGIASSRVGDAASVAAHSVIRFAPSQRRQAERVAAQFPFATPVAVAIGPLTLVIGRDAPSILLRHG